MAGEVDRPKAETKRRIQSETARRMAATEAVHSVRQVENHIGKAHESVRMSFNWSQHDCWTEGKNGGQRTLSNRLVCSKVCRG